jgi:hypothetical protein
MRASLCARSARPQSSWAVTGGRFCVASVGNRVPAVLSQAARDASLSERSEQNGHCASRSFLCERRRSRRILDVRAAEQEELAEQRFSVPPFPTKTAAPQRTSQRAEASNQQSAMREQRIQMG